MILKTFNSDLDGILNKLGFSERSIAEWGKQIKTSFSEAEGIVNKFNAAIKTAFIAPKDYIKNEAGEIVTKDNIDSYIPELTTDKAREELLNLQNRQQEINKTKGSWDTYNDCFKEENRKYLLDYAKANNVLEVSVDDLKEANIKAREATISHNKRLQQMTIRAKAAELGMKALSMAGNLIVSWAIGEAINLAVKGFDNFVNAADKAKEAAEKAAAEIKSLKEEVKEANEFVGANKDKYAEYAKGVSIAGENVSLTAEQFKEYHDITNQIAEKFPSMISGFDSEGNAILKNKGNVEELTKALNDYNKEKAKEAFNKIEDVVEGSNAEIHGKGLQIGENTRYRDTQDALKVLAGDKDVSKLRLVAFSQSSAEDLGLRKKGFFESIDSYKEYLQENIETVQQGTKEFSEKIDDLLLVIC